METQMDMSNTPIDTADSMPMDTAADTPMDVSVEKSIKFTPLTAQQLSVS